MGWYYSTSERVISVPVGNGEVVGVRPYTHVFVDSRMENRSEVRRLVSLGKLQRTGDPGRGAEKVVPAQPIAQAEVDKGAFSESIVAEGKESAPVDAPPKTKKRSTRKTKAKSSTAG